MQSLVGPLVEMISALQVQVPRREILSRSAQAAALADLEQPGLELAHGRTRDRLLRGEDVIRGRVDRF